MTFVGVLGIQPCVDASRGFCTCVFVSLAVRLLVCLLVVRLFVRVSVCLQAFLCACALVCVCNVFLHV